VRRNGTIDIINHQAVLRLAEAEAGFSRPSKIRRWPA
jgi:hypothetical protein